jgi:hypothetical protein
VIPGLFYKIVLIGVSVTSFYFNNIKGFKLLDSSFNGWNAESG